MYRLTKDRALALAMLLLIAIMLVESGNIPEKTSWQPYGSALFPRILLSVIGVLAAVILIKSLLTQPSPTGAFWPAIKAYLSNNRKILLLFALFGLYAALLPLVGYIAATLGFLLLSLALLLGIDSRRKWTIILAVSGTLVPLVYVVFRFGLNVWLP
ncbi:hypothetical protein GCM10007160_38470 [Litchfieldella qijiaojingensis]|uniref:DUF1468 domain-containing protein n=1 Tax=Litchfieldella qijiaojingensis TaxID=980347 RepID=A0ABQ2Z7P4_9GAMM|nr:tripartite tricarboxylate transporter TctB family protein [Halomonas qijiaojingensis]GGY07345.1 hypothetical protein GCM10007160_38470 [Halomonas qijiaojingensis]